ncbi:two-component system, NtrC family, sensor histidine kinase HupT/HoxJ [Solimonas aquatica]|uniref:histidine kinase n=1 Tax=Solimonas aquatica TaxID=489703 RepID=A0A1H9DHH6_9GAMM|nr:ATP-binding protein [Solimonas aquatica]SEQ12831.1 two-component system, NtrC family, sensor histidine kinase HupT/HoxJ [Solimonas aquatica]
MARTRKPAVTSLFKSIAGETPGAFSEGVWIDVVRKMDEVYADLIRYESDLESKNQALENAHNFISGVLSSMFDVLIACDAQGRIQQANRALNELTGIPEDELHGRPLHEVFVPGNRELVQSLMTRARLEVVKDYELILAGREGPMPLAVNCSRRHDRRNRFAGIVLIGRPVGELRRAYDALNDAHMELKRTQQQLIHSEKLATVGRLVAGVAHELNNPISFVYSNVHTLKKYGDRIRRYLDATQRLEGHPELAALRRELRLDRALEDLEPLIAGTLEGAERVRDIVNDLRRFTGSRRGPAVPVALRATLDSAIHWVTQNAARSLDVQVQVDPALQALGHEGPLHQVMVNLIQNALDAMEKTPHPQLSISAERIGAQVLLRFADNGPGISAENLSRIFDPFFTTKPVGKGTGLGLSISDAIVRDHGGGIAAENAPQGGAVFVMTLPAAEGT